MASLLKTLRTFAASLWPLDGPTALAAGLAALVPAIALSFHGPLAWLAGTVLVVVAIEHAGAAIRHRPVRVAVVGLAMAAVYVGNALLGASYFIQHRGFNDIFFANLGLNILPGLPMFRNYLLLVLAHIVVGLVVALWAAWRAAPRHFSWPLGAVALAAVLVFAPVFQVIAYNVSRYQNAQITYDIARVLPPAQPPPPQPAPPEATVSAPPESMSHPTHPEAPAHAPSSHVTRTSESKHEGGDSGVRVVHDPAPIPAEKPLRRNLVLIYLEGLEQAFVDEPGLMPRLSALRAHMLHFSNVHGVVGSTIGGMVSTQCGWPPFTDPELYQASTFYPGLRCLGDELKTAGYHNVFMEGFTLLFTRFDTFFGTHGFAEVLGRDQLLRLTPDPSYVNDKWGVEDDALFDLVRAKFESLAREDAPFTIGLITVDTHVPGFVSRSCSRYAGSEDMIQQAAHCTDQLVGEFVDFVHASPVADRTVIALVSDHLLWGGIADHGLKVPEDDRRLTLLLDRPGMPPREISAKGTEFDIGPTIAAALELKLTDPGRIGLGSSLLAGDGFLWTKASGLAGDAASIETFTHSDTVRNFVKAAREGAPVKK